MIIVMKFIKLKNRRGLDHNHGTKYVIVDLQRSDDKFNYEAGIDRLPRKNSKYWNVCDFMIWDVEQKEVRSCAGSINA